MDSNIDVTKLPPPPAWMTGDNSSAPSQTSNASVNVDVTKLPPPPAWMTQNAQPKDVVPNTGAGAHWYDQLPATLEGLAKSAAIPYLNIASLIPDSVLPGERARAQADVRELQRGVSQAVQTVGGMIGSIPLAAGAAVSASPLMSVGPITAALTPVGTGALLGAATSPPGHRGVGAIGGAAGTMLPGAVARAARFFKYLVNPESTAGAQGARAMVKELQQHVVPGEEPIMQNGPPAPTPPAQLPPTSELHKPSTIQINADLSKELTANLDRLDVARKAAGEKINSAIASTPQEPLTRGDPLYEDLNEIKRFLLNERKAAGTSTQRAAIQSVIKDINHIRNKSPTPLSSLVELRRQLSQKAKFGEEVTGFDAIGARTSASLSKKLNDLLDEHIPGYKESRAKYGDVLDEQNPFRTRLFKALGAEDTAGDLTARIMHSPQNLDLAIKAAGDVKPIDMAIAKRVQADMHGKSVDAMQAYIDEYQPILKKLPTADKTANFVFTRARMQQVLQRIQKTQEEQYKSQAGAYSRSHQLARYYQAKLEGLNKMPPDKLPGGLRSVLENMRAKNIISREKYENALDQVNLFEKSINRQKFAHRSTFVVGSGFAVYAIHRKMWNIIVRATE